MAGLSRREFVMRTGPISSIAFFPFWQSSAARTSLTTADEELLDDLSRRCFRYFWEQSDANTGIARDRAHADASEYDPQGRYIGSTGATGFALTALCVGAERGWIAYRSARPRPNYAAFVRFSTC